MKTTIDYINDLKAKTGAVSDGSLSKILGVTRQAVSQYRVGKSFFDDEIALRVASILEIEPFEVLINTQFERTKSAGAKTAYKSLFERLGGMAAAVTLGIMLNSPTPSSASTGAGIQSVHNASDLYIIRTSRRKKPTKIDLGFLFNNLISAH